MRRDDCGSVSLTLMALFLALFLAVGLVFDGGAVLATRRDVITAAESAARQAAATADPFTGALDQDRVDAVVRRYVAGFGDMRLVWVHIRGLRIEVRIEKTAHEVFFAAVGKGRTNVAATGSAEVQL